MSQPLLWRPLWLVWCSGYREKVTHQQWSTTDVAQLAGRLVRCLHLGAPPLAIRFLGEVPDDEPRFDAPMSAPAADGRQGRVPAGCVFWMRGVERSFVTLPEDHGNCSVGSVTHGLAAPSEVVGHDDVAELVGSGWVDESVLDRLPRVPGPVAAVVYGPLAEQDALPDVVLLRLNPRQLMVVSDGLGSLRIEGKPQCHIVALAATGIPAASVGCALSRQRTGMRPEELTAALPGTGLAESVAAIERAAATDDAVAKYAATDRRRFAC